MLSNIRKVACIIGRDSVKIWSFALALALIGMSAANAAMDSRLFEGMHARMIGPATTSGRVAAVDVVNSDTDIIYVGTASGGVWKSTDGGMTMEPIFEGEAFASIGAVAVDQSNPDVVWVGTGEGNVRNSTSIGGGIYKTIDGGRSWQLMGLQASERINRIAIDPNDSDTVYVAAMGTLWGANQTRGIYKTTDGGLTWNNILYVDENTGATDIKMDPDNPHKLYASMWEFRRWPYFFKSGGPGSGLYTSNDGGANWRQLTEEDGLPTGDLGRSVFAIARSQPDIVYALVEAEKSVLLRSDNGGVSWNTVNSDPGIAGRPFYYTELNVDPSNPDHLFNIESSVHESIDGGVTFNNVAAITCCAFSNTVHIDTHTYWIDPNNPDHHITGNDGGIAITYDGGKTYRFVSNMPVSQFYHVAVDNDTPYNIYGGLQDNGSWRGPSEVWNSGGIQNYHWQEVSFGDGFDTQPYAGDSMRGLSMAQGGNLVRWNLRTGEAVAVMPPPPSPDVELRFNWNAGLGMDPHNPDTIYYGSQFVHKSTDFGDTWEIISPDMTTNNPEHQTYRESGGLSYDVTAAENFTSIVSIAVSPVDENVIWVGTDDGRLHVTRDGGENWDMDIDDRARRVPGGTWIPMIDPSPHDASVAFVAFDDHRRSNMETYLYRAENYGRTMRRLDTSSVAGYALSVRQDHIDPNLLFLGTELGLFVSMNGGDEWMKWTAGVPTVSVMDLAIQARESDLVLGTHGRSFFVIDDYSGLRGLSEASFDQSLTLLSISGGIQYNQSQPPGSRFTGADHFRGENAPYGVIITFIASGDQLPHPDAEAERARSIAARAALADAGEAASDEGEDAAAPPTTVKVEVSDADGNILRTFNADVVQGINRISWGTGIDGNEPLEPAPGGNGDLPEGINLPPGTYMITLSMGDDSVSGEATLLADPRAAYSQADYEAGFAAKTHVMALQAAFNDALRGILSTREAIGTIKDIVTAASADDAAGDEPDEGEDAAETPASALLARAGELEERLDALEELFRNRPGEGQGILDNSQTVGSAIGSAFGHTFSRNDGPSATTNAYIELAEVKLGAALDEVNTFMGDDLARFSEQYDALGLSPIQAVDAVALPLRE